MPVGGLLRWSPHPGAAVGTGSINAQRFLRALSSLFFHQSLDVDTQMIKASVVILSWNSADVLGPCLTSLPQGFTARDYEVIIVDNGSRGLTPAALRCAFPWVQLVVNRKNRGVAPARNQGMRLARGGYIILLDDD